MKAISRAPRRPPTTPPMIAVLELDPGFGVAPSLSPSVVTLGSHDAGRLLAGSGIENELELSHNQFMNKNKKKY